MQPLANSLLPLTAEDGTPVPSATLEAAQQKAFNAGKDYFLGKFLEAANSGLNDGRSPDVYTHVTCATNTGA